jgi:hypothetical protein
VPIRPELRKFYGPEWRAYRAQMIEVHGAICSACLIEKLAYLNLAHTQHDPRSSPVALMCASCHNRHDARHRYAIWRRNRAQRFGQLWLWPEVQWAPFALWMVPKRGPAARANGQGSLF